MLLFNILDLIFTSALGHLHRWARQLALPKKEAKKRKVEQQKHLLSAFMFRGRIERQFFFRLDTLVTPRKSSSDKGYQQRKEGRMDGWMDVGIDIYLLPHKSERSWGRRQNENGHKKTHSRAEMNGKTIDCCFFPIRRLPQPITTNPRKKINIKIISIYSAFFIVHIICYHSRIFLSCLLFPLRLLTTLKSDFHMWLHEHCVWRNLWMFFEKFRKCRHIVLIADNFLRSLVKVSEARLSGVEIPQRFHQLR